MGGSSEQGGVAHTAGRGGASFWSLRREDLPEPLPPEPFALLKTWFDEACGERVAPNPDAMTLATVDPDGRPSARVVLCKEIEVASGSVVFYTNYASRKGRALATCPWAASVFHWDSLDRQARVEGFVTRVSDAESDAYFATRPLESQIGAWASAQSEPIASRAELLARVEAVLRQFGWLEVAGASGPPAPIPRPPNWGGYRLHADRVELWVAGAGRVHDRALWVRTLEIDAGAVRRAGPWRATRLQP